ncbi:MutS-related protein [Candidatus Vallotia sp. (ex Adelges kitamiensis)]|uniref:MutS-related protein n=1 Tax=Candidatus Vallotiella sp. (ex Adelges kitamiensis) TaxID=2864217 RepID=UPI001CE26407
MLNNTKSHSLVLVDPVDYTSTFDGRAFDWTIACYLLSYKQSYTFFAIHYFNLRNYNTKQYQIFTFIIKT